MTTPSNPSNGEVGGVTTVTPAATDGTTVTRREYRDFSLSVHARAAGRKPFKAQLELTYACNLHCVHCYTDCYNQPDLIRDRELRYEEIIGVLDQLADGGVLWLCLTGGEIFMVPRFFDIYHHARSRGFLITLFTNATLVTPRVADQLAEQRPFAVETSCHGATAETFEAVTQVPGSFAAFLNGVRLLQERRIPVRVKTTVMDLNTHEVESLRTLVESLGSGFSANPTIYPRLDGDLEPCRHRLSPEEIVHLESVMKGSPDASAEAAPHAVEDSPCAAARADLIGPPPDGRLFRCGCGTQSVHVNAWGRLGACTMVNEPRADLRSCTVAEGVARVFPAIRAARYETDTPCRDCTVYRFCEKMPAAAAPENGDAEQPVEHFCETAFRRAAVFQGRA